MFQDASAFNGPLTFSDTSLVTSTSGMFNGAASFNQPITFDVSGVTGTSYMFFGATAFNQDLCQFGQYFFQITTLYRMFDNSGCSNTLATPTSATGPWCAATTCPPWHSFTGNGELRTAIKEYLAAGCTDDPKCEARSKYGGAIGDWDVSGLKDFQHLFRDGENVTPHYYTTVPGGESFNEPINWDTGSATYMYRMFSDLPAFNQPLSLDTSKVASMGFMFRNATAFNQPLSFDTSGLLGLGGMFQDASAFNGPLTFSDTSLVTSTSGMFNGAASFNQPITFDVSGVTGTSYMFFGATAFNQDLCQFGQYFFQITTLYRMFDNSGCSNTLATPTSATGPVRGPPCLGPNGDGLNSGTDSGDCHALALTGIDESFGDRPRLPCPGHEAESSGDRHIPNNPRQGVDHSGTGLASRALAARPNHLGTSVP
ncbi:hypothetical protein THAOC_02394 [Thalassiosira oceanica]|uniref:Uncharacterized protein n=1 Tax=Thalassiosira oceanica TaxID=159749 RepID=K0TQD9_THAOC|nr:hypothetical protein THAOC_02394 [Thalassiosira oceanica]|eukprot:EJK75877.1 hypothetical protein THAOC_02394 [Thalassiosira oceanica]